MRVVEQQRQLVSPLAGLHLLMHLCQLLRGAAPQHSAVRGQASGSYRRLSQVSPCRPSDSCYSALQLWRHALCLAAQVWQCRALSTAQITMETWSSVEVTSASSGSASTSLSTHTSGQLTGKRALREDGASIGRHCPYSLTGWLCGSHSALVSGCSHCWRCRPWLGFDLGRLAVCSQVLPQPPPWLCGLGHGDRNGPVGCRQALLHAIQR